MVKPSENKRDVIRVSVDPGVCGFTCTIEARRVEKRRISIEICGSDCQQIQKMSGLLHEIMLRDLFVPGTRNPVFCYAEQAGCHSSCIVPVSLLKVAEVAMGMALARETSIKFKP